MAILSKNMTVVDVAEVGQRLARLTPPQRGELGELLTASGVADNVWDVKPRYIVIQGTVSNVVMLEGPGSPNPIRQVNVAFRESPPVADARPRFAIPEFGVCATNPEIFQDVFGKDFLTSMVGKTIEVQGEGRGGGNCGSLKAAVRSRWRGTYVWCSFRWPLPDRSRPVPEAACRSADDQRIVRRLHSGVDPETLTNGTGTIRVPRRRAVGSVSISRAPAISSPSACLKPWSGIFSATIRRPRWWAHRSAPGASSVGLSAAGAGSPRLKAAWKYCGRASMTSSVSLEEGFQVESVWLGLRCSESNPKDLLRAVPHDVAAQLEDLRRIDLRVHDHAEERRHHLFPRHAAGIARSASGWD